MMRALFSFVMTAVVSSGVSAQDAPRHSIGADVTFSDDADDTSVVRMGLNLDWSHKSDEDYSGIRFERTGYRPLGGELTTDRRVYLRLARPFGDWKSSASIGTDLNNIYGAATIHNEAKFRQEYFLERDKVETSKGVKRPIVYTFGGGALDIPFSDRSQVTLLAGLQTFTGANERLHLRVNAIQVLKSDWGLSAQLRTRYFRNSVPDEFDYYSPRWFAEALPVLQLRRYRAGWRSSIALGYGAQKDARSDWRQSRYANFKASSPASRMGWSLNADATYSNLPISNFAEGYSYVRASLGIARNF